jgi:X breakpoint 2-interacting protein
LQQVRIQQTHELKKKEKEFIKLQERLIQVLQEKKKESKTGMEIMNLLQKEGRQRGTWLNKKADGDFYKMIVDAYEAQKQELIAENTDLRNMLRSMQGDMNELNISLGIELPHTHLGGNLVATVQDIFDLPLHMARDQIEQSLQAGMTSIKECMVQLQKSQKHVKITES